MRSALLAAAFVLLFSAGVGAENPPVAMIMSTDAKPHFVAIDHVVLNLNALASVGFSETSHMLSVTFINGSVTSYPVKLTGDEWKKIQAEIVKAGQ